MMFTTACYWSLSWARWIQSTPSHPISQDPLSSHLCLGLLRVLFPSCFLSKMYAFLISPMCATYPPILSSLTQSPYPVTFCDKLVLVSPLPITQTGGSPLISCLWLLIQYICSYPPLILCKCIFSVPRFNFVLHCVSKVNSVKVTWYNHV